MSALELLYTDTEEDLRDAVRSLLEDRCAPDLVTATYDGDASFGQELWHSLAVALGLAGLNVPEDRGGAGGSVREAAVVAEELGRVVAPVPFLTHMVATALVQQSGEEELLKALASGESTGALLVPWSSAPHANLPRLVASGRRLSGTVTSVAGALEADVLLVPVASGSSTAVYAVHSDVVTMSPVTSLDMTRQLADVHLDQVEATVVLEDGALPLGRSLQTGAALLVSEQLGLSRWCLDNTVAYLKERRQFGRPVGGFQALKHRLADLYTSVESAAAAARYAAATLASDDPDFPLAISIASAFCGDVAVHAAEETVQLHGGIGMTWEHPAHLYLKRAKADQIAMGTSGHHRARVGVLANLPA